MARGGPSTGIDGKVGALWSPVGVRSAPLPSGIYPLRPLGGEAAAIRRGVRGRPSLKKSVFRVRRQQNDLPNATFLSEHMCFSRVTQRQAAPNRQHELPITQVVGKLPHL